MAKRGLFRKTFDSINRKIGDEVAKSAGDILDTAVDAGKKAGKKAAIKAVDVTKSGSKNIKRKMSGTTDVDTIEKLAYLRKRGMITEEEYIEAKKRILERL